MIESTPLVEVHPLREGIIPAEIKIVTGRSHPALAEKVAHAAGLDLAGVTIRNFSDGEIWVKYEENIRGVDLFIVQSTYAPSDNLMELLILIDAARRASASRITAVIPYFGYARQDRKDQPRVSITAKLVANLLTVAGADRVITIDLHTPQLQGFFDIPLDHLYASRVLLPALEQEQLDNLAVASPDVGGAKTARAYAKHLHADLVLVDKRRPAPNVSEVMTVIGDVEGKDVVIVDDLIDTGGTFVSCARTLKAYGARTIIGACTHAVFSGRAMDAIEECPDIERVYVTDTIPLRRSSSKIRVVSVAEMLAEAILRTHRNQSISSLFDIVR
ncbi:MAG: ribose-phosphate pyrophosphokinase [Candidatus Kapabacteria bacterium]|nr:ribose-phosphate pyrophosphokinase [Candidatus Kapabacteria bacterium]MCS7302501.1 ribose-phosphate pyrophosphokinase [Candidatus Kapabacteria bacterium]MCX7937278.1 ribose-phosphate pyrophosphokinase [Chlorobiota bacterium]